MTAKQGDLVQGTLDMLILKTLALEPMHGYGIAVRLEQMSKGIFRLNAGSLFVAFQRLQRTGLIRSEWKATENSRRAKFTSQQFPESSETDVSDQSLALCSISCTRYHTLTRARSRA